jgi:AcrR family transcriptional regulator
MARNDSRTKSKEKGKDSLVKANRKRKDRAGASKNAAPRGRDETMTAVLAAAAELFAERSPSQVSIREIAERAHVNHSLVHRHFGTKAELHAAVIKQSSREYVQRIDSTQDPAQAFREGFLYGAEERPEAAATARAVTDGYTPTDGERSFPMMTRHVALLEAAVAANGTTPRHSPAVIAAAGLALMSGWFILEDWFVEAAGLDDRPLASVREEIADILSEMVTAESGLRAPVAV